MEKTIMEWIRAVSYEQAALIVISIFIADFMAGVTAGIRSGRRIISSIMRQGFSKKATNYFYFLIVGLAFHYASLINKTDAIPFSKLATLITLLPAVPELLSIWENIKIMWTKVDTKPKEANNENN